MLNLNNKILAKLISLILAQAFLLTGLIYPESSSNKNISSIYIHAKALRVPIGSIDRMSKILKSRDSDINLVLNMKDSNPNDIIRSFNSALSYSMKAYLENEIQWQKNMFDSIRIPKKGDVSIILLVNREADFLNAAIAPRVGRPERGSNVKLINHTMLKERLRKETNSDIDKLGLVQIILFFDVNTEKITDCTIVPDVNQDKDGKSQEYLKVIELILSICKGFEYTDEELNRINLISPSETLFGSEALNSIAHKKDSNITYSLVDFYNFYKKGDYISKPLDDMTKNLSLTSVRNSMLTKKEGMEKPAELRLYKQEELTPEMMRKLKYIFKDWAISRKKEILSAKNPFITEFSFWLEISGLARTVNKSNMWPDFIIFDNNRPVAVFECSYCKEEVSRKSKNESGIDIYIPQGVILRLIFVDPRQRANYPELEKDLFTLALEQAVKRNSALNVFLGGSEKKLKELLQQKYGINGEIVTRENIEDKTNLKRLVSYTVEHVAISPEQAGELYNSIAEPKRKSIVAKAEDRIKPDAVQVLSKEEEALRSAI